MWVYVIQNADGKLYEGITDNLAKRIRYHRQARCKSTGCGDLHWEYLHTWYVETWREALQLERLLHCVGHEKVLDLILDAPFVCPVLQSSYPWVPQESINFHRRIYESY